MRFNDLLHLVAFPWKAHGTPPAPGFVTATKMPESRALSKFSDPFSRYIPLSVSGGGAVVIIVLVVVVLMLTVFNQPSDEELLVKALSGDQEASKKLGERYFTPVPTPTEVPPLSLLVTEFGLGDYTAPNLEAKVGAEVLASFFLLIGEGRVQEALTFAENPNDPGLLAIIEGFPDTPIDHILIPKRTICASE